MRQKQKGYVVECFIIFLILTILGLVAYSVHKSTKVDNLCKRAGGYIINAHASRICVKDGLIINDKLKQYDYSTND